MNIGWNKIVYLHDSMGIVSATINPGSVPRVGEYLISNGTRFEITKVIYNLDENNIYINVVIVDRVSRG